MVRWMVVVLGVACGVAKDEAESTSIEEVAPTPQPAREVVVPELPADPTWPSTPDADYPIVREDDPALAYLMEEPNRGPWVTIAPDLPSADIVSTRHAHCEVVRPTVRCSAALSQVEADPSVAPTPWTVDRLNGVVVAARREVLGDGLPTVWVWTRDEAGRLQEVSTVDTQGELHVAATFSEDGTLYRARARSGANALEGCGIWRIRSDDQGRIVEETCLGWDAQPRLDDHGVATRRHQLDRLGFVVETQYVGVDGRSAVAHSGATAQRYERDDVGRVVSTARIGPSGRSVVSPLDGCARWAQTYAIDGRLASMTCQGVDGVASRAANGVAVIRYGYDAAGNRDSERYFGPDDAPTSERFGVHLRFFSYDAQHRLTRQACFGTESTPVVCEPNGAKAVRYRYDAARGPNHQRNYVTTNGSWATDPEYGVPSIEVRFDRYGRERRRQCRDRQGEPIECGGTGFSAVEDRHDEVGRVVSSVFFDTSGERTSNLDTWERQFLYDSYDQLVEVRTLPTPGVVPSAAARRIVYDAFGRLSAVLLFDMQMAPARFENCFTGVDCPTQDWHAVRVVRDGAGNAVANVYYNANGHRIEEFECAGRCWE